jgi:hypothetical protein
LSNDDLYIGREQTLVKHIILKHYLERFAIIVGWHWDTLTYVDCFSGPWNVQSDDLKAVPLQSPSNNYARLVTFTRNEPGKPLSFAASSSKRLHLPIQSSNNTPTK